MNIPSMDLSRFWKRVTRRHDERPEATGWLNDYIRSDADTAQVSTYVLRRLIRRLEITKNM
jgi:hypothetical protein